VSLTIGARFGVYDVTGSLGAGGMGEVYRAHDAKLKRDVALKILPGGFTHDPERIARFQREATVLASLNHPHIGAIYGLEESNGLTALVLELVDGPTLSERIARGPIPLDEALPILRQIAEALETAHDKGVVHRDLKPANIKVRSDGTVKVLDFGLAKPQEPANPGSSPASLAESPTITSPALMTSGGMLLGTAAYMSPEQAKSRPVDKRSDIWAFGCVMFEMLTGHRAFGGDDVADTIAAVLAKEVDWSRVPASVPKPLHRLLRRCLEKDRSKRLADIADARFDLDESLTPETATLPPVLPAPARGWNTAMALVMASTGLAVGVGATWIVRRPFAIEATRPILRASILPAAGALPANTSNLIYMALSPDGKLLAYTGRDENSQNRVWLRAMDTSESKPLTAADGSASLFWSPDSSEIAFLLNGKLMRLNINGGPAIEVCNAPMGGSGGAWLPDGRIVFGATSQPHDFGLRACSADGRGSAEIETTLDATTGEGGHSYPFVLPDGRHVLYTAYKTGGSGSLGVYVGTPGSSERQLIVQDAANAAYGDGYLLFMRGTTLMAQAFDVATMKTSGTARPLAENVTTGGTSGQTGVFSISHTGTLVYSAGGQDLKSQLRWFDRSGRQIGVLGESNSYRNPRLSPDDTAVAVEQLSPGAFGRDIWLIDTRRGVPARFTAAPGPEVSPVWSHDGRWIVYGTNTPTIMRQSVTQTESNAELLLKSDSPPSPQDLTLSDDRLFFQRLSTQSIAPTAFVLSLADHKFEPVGTGSIPLMHLRLSPSGTAIAVVSEESGRAEVYVQEIGASSRKIRVSLSGGVQPVWRRDGKELYFLAPDNTLMSVPVLQSPLSLTANPLALFAMRTEGRGNLVPFIWHQYDVSKDGRFLVNTTLEDATLNPFTLVQNWPELLRQQ